MERNPQTKYVDCPECLVSTEAGLCCDLPQCPLHPKRQRQIAFDAGLGLYDHQRQGIDDVLEHYKRGVRAVAFCSPTGGGKGYVIREIARRAAEKRSTVGILTHRRLLLSRIADDLSEDRVKFRAYGAGSSKPIMPGEIAVISMATAVKRIEQGAWGWPDFDLLLIDEARLMLNAKRGDMIRTYVKQGTYAVGFDATPVGLGSLYNGIVQAGDNESLYDTGLLCKGAAYHLEVPNFAGVRRKRDGEYNQTDLREAAKKFVFHVWGPIWENFRRLNPDSKPTVLFGPSVGASLYLAERFNAQAGREIAAHVDGETDEKRRQDVMARMNDPADSLKVVCNYALLDCGWDFPGLAHGIFVRPFGTLAGYVQAVGRLKRASPGKTGYTLQDHAGNVWRHGDPDTNWQWVLDDDPSRGGIDKQWRRQHVAVNKQVMCPRCKRMMINGVFCVACHEKMVRHTPTRVIEHDGTLVQATWGPPEWEAEANKKKKRAAKPKTDAQRARQRWKSCLIASAHGGKTVAQAVTMYRWKHKAEPPEDDTNGTAVARKRLVTEACPWTLKIVNKYKERK